MLHFGHLAMWVKKRKLWWQGNEDLVEGTVLQNENGEIFMFIDGGIVPLACSYEESLGEPTMETLKHLHILHQ